MKPGKLKPILFGTMTISLLGLLLILSQYGEYDRRDLPSKIRVSATAMDGYHVHLKASFYPSRGIQGLCVPIMGTIASGIIRNKFNDIPSSGIEIETKRKWSGLCAYKLNLILVTCTKTDTFPDFVDDSIGWAGIGVLAKAGQPKDNSGYDYHGSSRNQLSNGTLDILVSKNGRNSFSGCDTACEDNGSYGIDKSNQAIKISCKEFAP